MARIVGQVPHVYNHPWYVNRIANLTRGLVPPEEIHRAIISTFKSTLYGFAGGVGISLSELAFQTLVGSSTPTLNSLQIVGGTCLAGSLSFLAHSRRWPEVSAVLANVTALGIRILFH